MVGRSRTGCLTCRNRKLKCDEQKPACGQCTKASRECVPSTGLVFRHQQNASMNQSKKALDDSLQGFYAYRNAFDENNVWVKTPKHVTFIVNAEPDYDPDRPSAGADGETGFSSREHSSQSSVDIDPTFSAHQDVGSNQVEALPATSEATDLNYQAPHVDSPEDLALDGADLVGANFGPLPPLGASSLPPSSSSDLNHILNPIAPSLRQAEPYPEQEFRRSEDFRHEMEVETDHETGFLLRHFTEVTGSWMDLFDLEKFFEYYVPVKALTNPLLKNAACAYAAKQLGRVQSRRPIMGGACSTHGPTEFFPHVTYQEWAYKGTQYYDRAIELLMEALRDGMFGVSRFSPEEAAGSPAPVTGEKRKMIYDHSSSDIFMSNVDNSKKRRVSQGRALSDEMAAATAMLCDYELQEAPGTGWLRHLDGTKSLLDIVEMSVTPLLRRSNVPRPGISRARQATFWNFARQDMLSALIVESPTRLDTQDLPMWRDAGLAIDNEGFIEPSNLSANGLPDGGSMKEDMISNALIWIIGKIVNYAVGAGARTQAPETQYPQRGIWDNGPAFDFDYPEQHESWDNLQRHLAVWYAGLPDSFKPCVQLTSTNLRQRYSRARTMSSPSSSSRDQHQKTSVFPEIWYNIPMCASTMQYYHMARMLLLLNQPQHHQPPSTHPQNAHHRASFSSAAGSGFEPNNHLSKSTLFTSFGSLKSRTADIEHHGRSICSIAVSRPAAAVRIHMVQPLYTAGQCLESTEERREILRLLREIQYDTGWASDYRVDRLLATWGWEG